MKAIKLNQGELQVIYDAHVVDGKNLYQLKCQYGYGYRILKKALKTMGVTAKTKSSIIAGQIPQLNDELWLRNKYEKEMLSIDDIAILLNTNAQPVKTAFKRFNISARTSSIAKRAKFVALNPLLDNKEWLYQQYIIDKNSINQLSNNLNVSSSALKTALNFFNIPLRSFNEQTQIISDKRTDEDKLNSKLSRALRSRLANAIKNNQKAGSAVRDLGCTVEDFKKYLESKWQTGMSWNNWGCNGWHIDHISPLASFDLTNKEEFLKACHYTNLQPMWAEINWRKSSKVARGVLTDIVIPKVTMYIITGMSGSGKTWVCEQLKKNLRYISYDNTPKEQHFYMMVEAAKLGKTILYDPLRKPITIARRYQNLFDIKIISIIESEDIIKQRLLQRGGTVHDNFKKYYDKSLNYAQYAAFSGTSQEVLEHIKVINNLVDSNPTLAPQISSPTSKPTITLLIGAPAAGKSWVASQLLDKYDYISYDDNRKKTHLDLLARPSDKPKLFDPTFKISTIIRRHSDLYNFVIVCIYESEAILRERMALRGGEFTSTILKRNEQVNKRFLKYGNGGFIGTSEKCLNYLRNRVA